MEFSVGHDSNLRIKFYSSETDINESTKTILRISPKPIKNVKRFRLIFTEEYFTDSLIKPELKTKYDLQPYNYHGKQYHLSKLLSIDDKNTQIMIETDFKSLLMSFIYIFEETAMSPSYNFKGSFSGWFMIVHPFLCFLEGLAEVGASFIHGRIVHMPQSSGYGKRIFNDAQQTPS